MGGEAQINRLSRWPEVHRLDHFIQISRTFFCFIMRTNIYINLAVYSGHVIGMLEYHIFESPFLICLFSMNFYGAPIVVYSRTCMPLSLPHLFPFLQARVLEINRLSNWFKL